jgi:Pyruvate/2-oxoacid:ferredoxin oxidoreductase delta subunit
MKIALVYFSGTGVTAKFAHDLAEGFKEQQSEVEFFRLKRGTKLDLADFDIIGIGSPAYSFRIPWLASRLIRETNFHFKPIFIFCTSGGMPGNALWNIYRAARKTTAICLGFIEGIGTTNLRSWMPKKNDEKVVLRGLIDTYINNAKRYGADIINRYNSWKQNPTKGLQKKWKPFLGLMTLIWTSLFTWRWQMALTVGLKRVNKEKCTNCNLCAEKICPSGAIELREDDYPKFNEWKCVGCNGCVNLCPEDAIWSYMTRKHVQYDLYADYILK